MTGIVKLQPKGDEVYKFYEKKRSEGKHYYVCMTAASAKFLRVYFGKVRAALSEVEKEPELLSDNLTTAA
jgi:hypothetical protein